MKIVVAFAMWYVLYVRVGYVKLLAGRSITSFIQYHTHSDTRRNSILIVRYSSGPIPTLVQSKSSLSHTCLLAFNPRQGRAIAAGELSADADTGTSRAPAVCTDRLPGRKMAC